MAIPLSIIISRLGNGVWREIMISRHSQLIAKYPWRDSQSETDKQNMLSECAGQTIAMISWARKIVADIFGQPKSTSELVEFRTISGEDVRPTIGVNFRLPQRSIIQPPDEVPNAPFVVLRIEVIEPEIGNSDRKYHIITPSGVTILRYCRPAAQHLNDNDKAVILRMVVANAHYNITEAIRIDTVLADADPEPKNICFIDRYGTIILPLVTGDAVLFDQAFVHLF